MSIYTQISPSTGNGWENNRRMIEDVARLTGMPLSILKGIAGPESGWNVSAKNALPGQSAKGLFQFTDGSWRLGLKAYGAKYGIPMNASSLDPRANALMTAAYFNHEYLPAIKRAGRTVSPGEVYAVHFLGGPEYARFAKALQANPHTTVDKVLRNSTLLNNKGYLYHSTGKGKNRVYTTPRTLGELANLLEAKMGGKGVDYGSAPIMVNGSGNSFSIPTVNKNIENSISFTGKGSGKGIGYVPLNYNSVTIPSMPVNPLSFNNEQRDMSLLDGNKSSLNLLEYSKQNPMSLLSM